MRFNLDNYETVETRLAKFWAQFPNGQVFTAIHHYDDNKVVFRAEIYKDISDPRPVATGYAEEVRDLSPVNKTSHVENAETSAIGRALANYVFQSKTAPRPSREEMTKVVRQDAPKPAAKVGPDMLTKFREACAKQGLDPQDVAREAQVDLANLSDADMPKLRDKFNQLKQAPTAVDVADADKLIEQIREAFPSAQTIADTPQIKDPDAPATTPQIAKIRAMLSGKGIGSYTDKIEKVRDLLNNPHLKKLEQMTKGDANKVIFMIEEMK
jgi:superfamily I DNA/RNA helicase